MKCNQCGKEIEDNSIYCSKCGSKVLEQNIHRLSNSEDINNSNSLNVNKIIDSVKNTKLFEFIKDMHFVKFLKYSYKEKHYGILLYSCIMIYLIYGQFHYISTYDGYHLSISEFFVVFLIFLFVLLVVFSIIEEFLNGFGQKILCFIIGAKKIERREHIEKLKLPILNEIKNAKNSGLQLPEYMEVYVIDTFFPLIYAIGMNTIVVSTKMGAIKKDIFKAKILTELYRINRMSPDNLLFLLGSNILLLIFTIFVMIFGSIYLFFGDRNKYGEVFSDSKYGGIVIVITLAGITLWLKISSLFVSKRIKDDILEGDLYAYKMGYGEELCIYLDHLMPKSLEGKYKLFEIMGQPSKDERIASLQRAGVNYNS